MKKITTIILTLISLTSFAQSIETITEKISDKICECMSEDLKEYSEIKPEFNRCYDKEFRVRFSNNQIRLLSFWDKRDNENTLVITTNGFVKKTQKTPKTEINKAKKIRSEYLKY